MSNRLERGCRIAVWLRTKGHTAALGWLLLASSAATSCSQSAAPKPSTNDSSTYGNETTESTVEPTSHGNETTKSTDKPGTRVDSPSTPGAVTSAGDGVTAGAPCSGVCEFDASSGAPADSDAGAGSFDSNVDGPDASVSESSWSPEPMVCELSGHTAPRAAGGELYFLELTCGEVKAMNSRCYIIRDDSKSCDCGDGYWLSISPSSHVDLKEARAMSIDLCNFERTRAVADGFAFETKSEFTNDTGCWMTRTWRPLVDDYFVPARELSVSCASHSKLSSDEWLCSCEFGHPSTIGVDTTHSFSVRSSALTDGCATVADLCFDYVDAVPRPGATCTASNNVVDATRCLQWLDCEFAAEINGVTVRTGNSISVDCSAEETDGPVVCTVYGDVRTATFIMPAGVTADEGCGAIAPDVLVRSVAPSQNPLPTAAELLAITPLSNFEGPPPDVK